VHYQKLFDSEYVGAWDLTDDDDQAVDKVVTIEKVERKEIKSQRGTEIKPVLFFRSSKKGMICNKTNCRVIANMFGPRVEDWEGKRITLYQTTTNTKDGDVPCIRVRPTPPRDEQPKANGGKPKQARLPGEEG
jgi:hypothetical protein